MQKQEPDALPVSQPGIRDQLKLERRMITGGISRYRHSVKAAEEDSRGADTKYAQKLLHSFVLPVADAIRAFNAEQSAGVKGKYKPYLRAVNPEVAAFITLKALFNNFTIEQSLASLAAVIGQRIEDELRFDQFRKQHGAYYDSIIDDFSKKGTTSYRHMHRVLTLKANEKEVSFNKWDHISRVAVGIKLLDCVMQATDLITKSTSKNSKKGQKDRITIAPTKAAVEWIESFNHSAELLYPDQLPCIIEPDPWISFDQGGYYTPHMRSRVTLVKTGSKAHRRMFQGDISQITSAVNSIQSTPWAINKPVLEVLDTVWKNNLGIGLPRSEPYEFPECPVPKTVHKKDMTPEQTQLFTDWKYEARTLHTMEKERVSKCFQTIRCLRLATEYSQYERFWFVHQCDFRGRVYATVSGLSPQGADFAKGILRFADGKTLGERGLYWLKVHGANTYGKDKLPYGDRVRWVEENSDAIVQVAEDPLSHRELWANADKPWQFLAFCFEWKRYREEGVGMQSHLPVGLDGSCNGLQNFSALLRDSVGGTATNLVPGDRPRDIYAEVARVASRKVAECDDECAGYWKSWLTEKGLSDLPRGLAKKPVMTLPYGSTKMTCRDSIYAWMVEQECIPREHRMKAANWLSPILWNSINEVVIAARAAMTWLQKSAVIIGKDDRPCIWWSPIGFPVLQDRRKTDIRRVGTQLMGSIRLVLEVDNKHIDAFKQRLGIAPNFVHSLDAAHMMKTVNQGRELGITHWACIHDDFGCHAADVEVLFHTIRETFVEMYQNSDPLQEFKSFHESEFGLALPPLPDVGNLKLDQVIESKYFFA